MCALLRDRQQLARTSVPDRPPARPTGNMVTHWHGISDEAGLVPGL